jgi:AbrB family looped-hinge helix DNA binding protein
MLSTEPLRSDHLPGMVTVSPTLLGALCASCIPGRHHVIEHRQAKVFLLSVANQTLLASYFTFLEKVKHGGLMREVKLSTKNQIVIARDVREALGVKAGDRLLVVPRGNTVVLLRKPKKYSNAIAGMAKDLYGPTYLGEERESWR